MSDTRKERELLKAAYSGDAWKKKVEKMSDAQVIAVYRRLQSENKV